MPSMSLQQPMHLYEYAVVRLVPRVEREEFVNVGLVMMCKRRRWLRVAFDINEERIRAIAPDFDVKYACSQLDTFQLVVEGREWRTCGLEVEERFRWLTAVRSACIATSRPHPGLCENLDETFERLFRELVL